MKKTLFAKFFMAYALFAFFSFILLSTFVPRLLRQQIVTEKTEVLYEEAQLLANTYASELYSSDSSLETVTKELNTLAVFFNCSIRIINPSGRLIIETGRELNTEEVVTIEGFDATQYYGKLYIQDNFFNQYTDDVLTVLSPIVPDYSIKGYVTMHYPMAEVENTTTQILNIFYITMFSILVLSLIILIFYSQFVQRPLRKITKGAEEFAKGNMKYEINVDTDGEIAYLAACLNYMATEINDAHESQKKFIANVSHDFRSPLTSIRGYMEAMLDGTIPLESHEKYIGIVLNETNRLTKLTNSLLSLNNLNAKGTILDLTDFDINQVIRNTIATFEGSCKERRIVIKLVLTGEEMYVHADLGKIQQVLYNLIDNAIKFSHNNSIIKIETNVKKKKVLISVKDSGIGIPKEDQKLVFDRFYKSDASRGKDKKGTGLGLSIVKEIIIAHNENINVISTEGVGTEFIFSLAQAKHEVEED